MDFQKVELVLPETVERVFEAIEKLEPNSCIAGGFLLDLYLDKPFKDVDIFVNYKNRSTILNYLRNHYRLKCLSDEYTSFMNGENGVYEFAYKNITFQVIFTSYGSKQVERFDLRCKEFYYMNGTSYASNEALMDIRNNEVTLGIIHDIKETSKRAFDCVKKYNFRFSEKAREMIIAYLGNAGISRFIFSDGFYQSLNAELKGYVDEFISQFSNSSYLATLTKKKQFLKDLTQHFSFTRDQLDEIYERPENVSFQGKRALKVDFMMKEVLRLEEKIKKDVQSYTLELLYENPDIAEYWRENIKSSSFLHTIFKQQLDSYGSTEFKKRMREAFYDLERVVSYNWLLGEMDVRLSDKYIPLSGLEFERYLNGEYLCLTVNNRQYVYDKTEEKFLSNSTTVNNLFKEMLEDILTLV